MAVQLENIRTIVIPQGNVCRITQNGKILWENYKIKKEKEEAVAGYFNQTHYYTEFKNHRSVTLRRPVGHYFSYTQKESWNGSYKYSSSVQYNIGTLNKTGLTASWVLTRISKSIVYSSGMQSYSGDYTLTISGTPTKVGEFYGYYVATSNNGQIERLRYYLIITEN